MVRCKVGPARPTSIACAGPVHNAPVQSLLRWDHSSPRPYPSAHRPWQRRGIRAGQEQVAAGQRLELLSAQRQRSLPLKAVAVAAALLGAFPVVGGGLAVGISLRCLMGCMPGPGVKGGGRA